MKAPLVFSFLFFVLQQGYSQTHESSQNTNKNDGVYGKAEKQAEYQERKQLQLFTVNLLKDYGCRDFQQKAFEAILENLRQNSQPRLSAKDRHKSMISSLRVYNETDRPAGSFEPAKKEFSSLLFQLTSLTTEKLFSYYVEESNGKSLPMNSSDIANILETEKVSSFETPKKKILDILRKLNFLVSDNHLDIGCRNEENKNFLMLNHPLGIVSLNDFYRYKNLKKEVPREAQRDLPKIDTVKPQENEKPTASPDLPAPTVEKEKIVTEKHVPSPAVLPLPFTPPATPPVTPPATKPSMPTPTLTPSPSSPPVVVRPPMNPPPQKNPQVQETQPPQKTHDQSQPEAQVKPKARKDNHEDTVRKFLSLDNEELLPYMKRGWSKDYEAFIVALILDDHRDLLDQFHQFEKVCYDLSSYDSPQKKARFIAKFFKALAIVETDADPRIETLESFEQKYRPRSKAFPKVAGKPYKPHSSGLFQLDENDYFNYGCREINYERDVSIGHPSSRQIKTNHHTHPEFIGDSRKSILNPFVNASCAVKILEKNISSGIPSSNSYWSPLKSGRKYDARREKMQKTLVKEIPSCKFPAKNN